jgi:hypothetical protein
MHPGEVIGGKYLVVRPLGQGGMGAVWQARHLTTERRVAIKVIAPEFPEERPELLARLEREARAAGIIESQHVAQVLDAGICDDSGDPFLVIEYLAGYDLRFTVGALGPLRPATALRIVAQACIGLAKAHEAGVIHRDIKSANVFLADGDAGAVIVKLLDFGIAKVDPIRFSRGSVASLTLSGNILGSPFYMSPEQARAPKTIDHRTDIWSLGVVLYEILSGATPFVHCKTLGPLLYALYNEEPPPIRERAPWIAADIAAIVHRALARDPDRRFQSAQEMLDALNARLPQGHALHESMIVALPPAERAIGSTALIPVVPPVVAPPSGATPHGSTAPVALAPPRAAAEEVAPRGRWLGVARAARSRGLPVAAGVATVFLLAGGLTGALGRGSSHREAAPGSPASSLPAGVAALPPGVPGPPASARASAEPTVLAPEPPWAPRVPTSVIAVGPAPSPPPPPPLPVGGTAAPSPDGGLRSAPSAAAVLPTTAKPTLQDLRDETF